MDNTVVSVIVIWLVPSGDKMNPILHCDGARSGSQVVSRSGSQVVSRTKTYPKPYNHSLTKLVRSRWLDLALFLGVFIPLDPAGKKNLANIQPS